MLDNLKQTLKEVLRKSGNDFSGVGIIVHDGNHDLPIFPLRLTSPDLVDNDITKLLIKISSVNSKYHDGFHLIASDWQVTHTAQYFSPPILQNVVVDRTKPFGGRYIAALFGSAIPGVLLTGIASNGFGLAIFQSGKEVYFKKDIK